MQQRKWQYDNRDVDWDELSTLYKRAPLGDKDPALLQKVFANSLYQCFVYDEQTLIGVGRALADGGDCSYLCDIAVLPEYQGQGLGSQIVEKLLEFSKGHKKIILFAAPGKEPLYLKHGFLKMKTAMAIFEHQERAIEWGLLEENLTYTKESE